MRHSALSKLFSKLGFHGVELYSPNSYWQSMNTSYMILNYQTSKHYPRKLELNCYANQMATDSRKPAYRTFLPIS